jgi:hypothetical protein
VFIRSGYIAAHVTAARPAPPAGRQLRQFRCLQAARKDIGDGLLLAAFTIWGLRRD